MMMMPVQQNQMIQNPMMQPQSPMGQMGQMSQPMGPQMMQPMMQPLMDQPLEASQQMENSQVQGGMEPANQLHEPSSQENTEINLIPKTPELTPETPPELPDTPLLDQEPEDVFAPTPNWTVTIKNQSGTESVVGPVWVACVMISSLEFVHPETQRPLSEMQLSALEKVLPMCEPTPPAALKILRAYQLSRSQKMSPEESQELKKMQATANDELRHSARRRPRRP